MDRLNELKELKAESTPSSSSGRGRSVENDDGLQKKKKPSSSEGIEQHGIIFCSSLLLYAIMNIFLLSSSNNIIQASSNYQTFIEVCLIFLQASCLRSLLYLLSLSAFDAIEFVGRADKRSSRGGDCTSHGFQSIHT